jgi:hypothetical protein
VTEQELTKAIIDRLKLNPDCWVFRANVGVGRSGGRFVRFGLPGQADISGILRGGKRLELEVKLPEGKHKVTPEQQAFGEAILAHGGVWAVVKSVEEAVSVIQEALR